MCVVLYIQQLLKAGNKERSKGEEKKRQEKRETSDVKKHIMTNNECVWHASTGEAGLEDR